MASRLEELWGDYEATLPRLVAAREEHDAAYKETTDAYRRWVAAGGESREEPGYGKK